MSSFIFNQLYTCIMNIFVYNNNCIFPCKQNCYITLLPLFTLHWMSFILTVHIFASHNSYSENNLPVHPYSILITTSCWQTELYLYLIFPCLYSRAYNRKYIVSYCMQINVDLMIPVRSSPYCGWINGFKCPYMLHY